MMLNNNVRVLIADERRICRETLRQVFSAEEGMDLAGEASDWLEAINSARELRPDVALVSALLPGMGWTEGAVHMRIYSPSTKILLCCASDEALIIEALDVGARGYLLDDTCTRDFVRAVRAVHQDELWIERRLVTKFLRGNHAPEIRLAKPTGAEAPTLREVEVLRLLAEGHSNKQMARALSVTESTIKAHLHNIFQKLGFERRSQATAYAVRYYFNHKNMRSPSAGFPAAAGVGKSDT